MEKRGEWWRDWETPHKPNTERERGGGYCCQPESTESLSLHHQSWCYPVQCCCAERECWELGGLSAVDLKDGGRIKNKWVIQGFCVKGLTWKFFWIVDNKVKSLHLRSQETHDVPLAAFFTQAAKSSIRSLQPSVPFSAILGSTTKACSHWHPSTIEYLVAISRFSGVCM